MAVIMTATSFQRPSYATKVGLCAALLCGCSIARTLPSSVMVQAFSPNSKTPKRISCLAEQSPSSSSSSSPVATITVCTGPDCRVDGSSKTLKQLQACVGKVNQQFGPENQKSINIKSRNCLGPCGEGPCVKLVNNVCNPNLGVFRQDQPNREPSTSFLPADSFGADTKRIYQVRNAEQAQFVLDLAVEQVVETKGVEMANPAQASGIAVTEELFPTVMSSRAWYDRNNNDRKVLQRLSQGMVAVGLLEYSKSDYLGPLQWGIAVALVAASNFIMKDNLLQKLWQNLNKRSST